MCDIITKKIKFSNMYNYSISETVYFCNFDGLETKTELQKMLQPYSDLNIHRMY